MANRIEYTGPNGGKFNYTADALYSEKTFSMSRPAEPESEVGDDWVRLCKNPNLVECYDFYVDPDVYDHDNPLYLSYMDYELF